MSPPELEKFICQRENKASVFTSNKKAITAIGAELDRHLRSPLFSKPFLNLRPEAVDSFYVIERVR